MSDRQALFEQLITHLAVAPPMVNPLEPPLVTSSAFDPYQMVAEWIALKQEVKQQGKLLHAAQESLQQALARQSAATPLLDQAAEAEKAAAEKAAAEKALLKDLLPIMDALDQACDYWQAQLDALPSPASSFWQKLPFGQTLIPTSQVATLKAMFLSHQQGMAVMRRSLLDLFQRHKLTPIPALGQPFDPSCMYAIARQSSDVPANTVIQEVVRGYRWQEQILREAQVIVAGN